jgi:tRNA (guanine-N7-)-methyltransferase
MSARREFALNELLPKFEISRSDSPLDLANALDLTKVIVDFGCGMGTHTLELATRNPKVGVLAIDVHTVGLLAIVESATEQNLTNIRTHHGDGIDVFKDWLKPSSIDEVHVLFPDPWPKARQHKRRLITQQFLALTFALLKPDGRIIFVTDNEEYFASAAAEFNAFEKFDIDFDDWEVPKTTYHLRALSLNHKISQLSARKI